MRIGQLLWHYPQLCIQDSFVRFFKDRALLKLQIASTPSEALSSFLRDNLLEWPVISLHGVAKNICCHL